ncbi:amidase [Sphingomonas flavalba]|uniref:amidase n=1 Tax=Sphingomonas flavalba TaxID=2559804 RepID=UPI00109DCEFE|nr:amidase [Sphingomonas flavalba]
MSAHASRAAIDAALMRADQPEAEGVFTLRLDKEARAFAEAADARRAARSRAPFLGVPITVKDNFDLMGHPTTAGSRLLADAPPPRQDAAVLERLRRAGFIIIGRTNMTEFAFSGLGLNPHFGTPANPAFPGERRIPGGSSSGAAVSVALGIVPAAIGTDTGGSVRIPAALCGLSGFKPTADAVTRAGVLPLSTTLDSVGVIAKSVADCAALFDVIRDRAGPPRHPMPARRIRLGLVRNYVMDGIEPAVADAFEAAVARIEAGGIAIERITLPELDGIPAMMREASFAAAETAAWHAPYLAAGRSDAYDPRVLTRIRAGETMAAPAYVALVAARAAMIEAVGAKVAGLDALLWPTVPFVAPTIATLADDDTYYATNALALRNSTVANLLDGCAISIPCPTDGPPVGLTLAALSGRDDHLLSVSATVQTVLKGG